MTQETQDRGVVTAEEKLAYLAEVCKSAIELLNQVEHDCPQLADCDDENICPVCGAVCDIGQAVRRVTEPRRVMFVNEAITTEDGEFIPCIAVEGERGYNKTDWAWGKDYEQAEKWCEERNTEQGIGKIEATRIVLGTMRGTK